MSQVCTDCDFAFSIGPDGQRMLSPAMEFMRLSRFGSDQETTAFNERAILDYPETQEDVRIVAPGCPDALTRFSTSAIRVNVSGWYDIRANLAGEQPSGNAGTSHTVGLVIELVRDGSDSVLAGDVQTYDNVRQHVYNAQVFRRLNADDVIRTAYYMNFGVGERPNGATLPASAFNWFSVRLHKRA